MSRLLPDRDATHHQVGPFVTRRRRAAGLTQQALAELAGVGPRLVGEIERDKPTLRLDGVNRVLAVFGKQLGVVERPRGSEGARP